MDEVINSKVRLGFIARYLNCSERPDKWVVGGKYGFEATTGPFASMSC